ncbi:hypothetical protein MNB_SUP05-SYMBIONT-4-1073 [hydrothermal vent metagenome]|uniref:Radical SAM core domain-containing protein n=1 Tax=hydrothermal vent metagenome TaxID=652676 RepID=A0A1W1E0K8_9ZZZZ
MMDKITKRFDTIAYVRPTEKCNLRCKHCFIPPNPATMSDEQILDIPRQLSGAGVTGNVLLQWHGGEPLLVDPTRCEELIVGLNANNQNINFLHGVQTNLVVLGSISQKKRDKWYQVLATYFDLDLIGVSWDDSIRGINLVKTSFYDDFEQSLHKLRASEYFADDFSPTITITAAKPFLKTVANFETGMQFLKWLEDMGLYKIHIEKLTPTGDAISNWDEIGVSNLEYSKSMGTFYLIYKRYKNLNPRSILAISPFCDLEDAIKTGKQDNICAAGACQSSMFTFSSKGVINTCTAIAEHSEVQLENYQNNVNANCFDCEFNPICNGGCPAHNNVVDTSNECSGAKQLLTTIKETYHV